MIYYKLELNDILHPHHHHYPYQLGLSREQPQKLIFLIFDLPAASRIEAAKEAALHIEAAKEAAYAKNTQHQLAFAARCGPGKLQFLNLLF